VRTWKWLAAVAAAAAVAVAVAAGAQAVTNGQPDQGRHPYVGLLVALDKDGFPLWRCTGSLIAPAVVLTAGHCTTAPAAHIEVWFSEGPVLTDPNYAAAAAAAAPNPVSCNASAAFDGYPCKGDAGGATHTNPDFCNPCGPGRQGFVFRDVGVVTLDAAVPTSLVSRRASLPAASLVDTLANKSPVDFVGYGVQVQAQIPGNLLPQPPPFNRWTGPRSRLFAPSELVSGKFAGGDEFLRLAFNPGGGSGGTCFGDSGGPDLRGGTDVVLGVNSNVTNVNCSGVGYSQRVDVPAVRNWILSFVP
jgi:hypothetical protein